MQDDLSPLFERIHALPDDKLISLLEQETDLYTQEAISVAEVEAETRGGLLHLKQEQALARSEQEQGSQEVKHLLERVLSILKGRSVSEQYPGLSYVSIAMRLLAFIFLILTLVSSVGALYNLLAGNPQWWWGPVGGIQPALRFLLFYGGSELINVVLDIEKSMREGSTAKREDQKPPLVV